MKHLYDYKFRRIISVCTYFKKNLFNPCTDTLRKLVRPHQRLAALLALIYDMTCTLNDPQMDNISYPVRQLIACHSLHKYNNPHENLCPSRLHEQFLPYLQLV